MTVVVAPPLRDYLLGTTHRKDALKGALWEKLREQLAGRNNDPEVDTGRIVVPACEGQGISLPHARHSAGTLHGDHDAAATLSLIVQDAAGIVRWEPINPNAEHRTCPSPGNRFTVDLEIACLGKAGVRRFRYLPRERMLALVTDSCDSQSPDDGDLLLVLRGHLDRCAEPYGDLALCLATTEIGAMLAQAALALGGVGLGMERVRFDTHRHGLDPVLQAQVRAPALAHWLAHAPSVPIRFAETPHRRHNEIGGRLLQDLHRLVSDGRPPPNLFPHGLAASDCGPLLQAAAVRSSGLDLAGTGEGRPEHAQLLALVDAVRRIHAAFRGLAMLPFRLDVRTDAATPTTGWERDVSDASAWLHLAPAADPSRSPGYTHPTGAVIVTVSAGLRDYAARTGAMFLSAMHLAAGIATQMVCIAAAGAGLACRPMRSFDHAAADAALPLDCWSLIQLVVYADRAPNPTFAPSSAPVQARR